MISPSRTEESRDTMLWKSMPKMVLRTAIEKVDEEVLEFGTVPG